jgi:hypothetical protein
MPKHRGKVEIEVDNRGKLMARMGLHYLEIGPREKMTPEQIASAYEAACQLIDIAANYECFGPDAEVAEDLFGQLIEALQADD